MVFFVLYIICGIAASITHRIIAVRMRDYYLYLIESGGISEDNARYNYNDRASLGWVVLCFLFPLVVFQFLGWVDSPRYNRYRRERVLKSKPDVFRIAAERKKILEDYERNGLRKL